jgi:hypothetical protein
MNQEDASILLLRVALMLLGEARLRGDFGEEAALGERAVALADELTGGAPSPDPRRAVIDGRPAATRPHLPRRAVRT